MAHYNDIIRDYWHGLTGEDGPPDKDFRPLYAIDHKDEEKLIKWLNDTVSILGNLNSARAENQLRNIQFYRGIHTLENSQGVFAQDLDRTPITMENRFVLNHILEFTLQKQARLMRFSPSLNVTPWSNEYALKLGARLGKKVIDSAFYVHNMDDILADMTLEASICGETFVFPEWDKNAGDKDPKIVEAMQREGAEIGNFFKMGKDGQPESFVADNGDVIPLEEIERVGDHKFDHPLPFHVLHEPRIRWRDVKYLFKGTIKHIDQIRAENKGLPEATILAAVAAKDSKGNIPNDSGIGTWIIEWEFYHRFDRFMPEGKYARFFNTTLIEQGKLPYSHGEIPVVRFTDYDDPVNAHGRSFYEDLKVPSVMINNMMKVAYRSFCIAAYPKLIMAKDSCNMYSMANGPFVVEYTPGLPEPKMVTFNAVNSDFFPLSQHVEEFMEKSSGIFAMSRGGTIPNARAKSILSFYAEQEEQRDSSQIRKFTACTAKMGRMVLGNSGDYYKQDDGRTLRVVGKSNQYKIQKIKDVTKLSGPYDVKVERTTALSESKQGRVDQIVQLSSVPIASEGENPGGATGLFTREQLLEMIEVADSPTFFEMATASAERAASENEDLFEGVTVQAPMEHQMHLVDWNSHFQFMQSREFSDTEGLPPEVKTAFLDHLRAHEFFLYQKAKINLGMAMILSQNKYFPAVFKLNPLTDLPLSQVVILLQQPPMMPPPMGVAAGVAALPPPGAGAPAEGGGEPAQAPDQGDPNASDLPQPDELPQPDAALPRKKVFTITDPNGLQSTAEVELVGGDTGGM